jgi:probable HAF family extracellular repeat protein
MRLTTLAGVVSCSLLLTACDSVEKPTPPETQSVKLHIAGALKITMTDLGTLGGNFSIAEAINRYGTVVGYAATSTGALHAFRWDGTTMHDLTPSSGAFSNGAFSRAVDVNDLGRIAGTARLTDTGIPLIILVQLAQQLYPLAHVHRTSCVRSLLSSEYLSNFRESR